MKLYCNYFLHVYFTVDFKRKPEALIYSSLYSKSSENSWHREDTQKKFETNEWLNTSQI